MLTTPDSIYLIQVFMALPFLMLGLSHLLQGEAWQAFFSHLHGLGTSGVILRSMTLELAPALLIVNFHWYWRGPAALLTLYGTLLLIKVTLSLLSPRLGLRSLALADQVRSRGFFVAGCLLIGLGLICVWGALSGSLSAQSPAIA